MKKNFDKIFTSIEVDTVTGEYYTIIPEEIINEYNWYEETQLKWVIDNDDIILRDADSEN
tara:strand:- start:1166 stop:1345 length:180 start_codon:yes stop_codon:yes gene_type:complete